MFWNEVKMTGRPGGRFPGHLTQKPGVTCICNSPKCFKNKANFLYFMGTYESPLIFMSVTHAHRGLLGAHVILQTSSCSGLSNAGTLFLASKVRIKSWWLNSLSTAVGIINFVHRFLKSIVSSYPFDPAQTMLVQRVTSFLFWLYTGCWKIQKNNNWARSRETCLMPYANNKSADQPAHSRSLIRVFVVRCLDGIKPILATCTSKISRF